MSDINVNITDQIIEVDVVDQIVEVEVNNAAGPQGPAGPGVPVGGTAGQLLVKESSTDYDTGWSTTNATLGEFGLSAGYFQVDTTPTNTPGTQGTMYWDDNAETVALVMNGTVQKVGEDVFYHVVNQSGSSIPKGTAVRFAGTDGNSGKLLIAPFLANGTYPSFYYMGITAETIANGSAGKVYEFGKMRNINTSIYNDGDILYASSTVAGGFQTTAPSAPNNIIVVAAVVNAANNGTLMIRSTITDAGGNIYNTDGTLTGNRTVTMGSNTLSFEKDIFVNSVRLGKGNNSVVSNTALGQNALAVINAEITGNDSSKKNTAVGYYSQALSTTGFQNTSVGHNTLAANTTGRRNTAVGNEALKFNTFGSWNVAIGDGALLENSTGYTNNAIGVEAMRYNTNGVDNVALGSYSLHLNSSGNENISIGSYSLYNKENGSKNIAIGYSAGERIGTSFLDNTASDNSIFIGADSRPLASSQTNQIVIGYQGRGLGSNTTVIGNSSTTFGRWFGNLLLGTSINSGYLLDVNGTTRLNGVTTIGTINAATTDTDKFLVSDSGEIKFRTGAELLSDISAVPTTITLSINGESYDLSANRSWTIQTTPPASINLFNYYNFI